MKKSLLIVCLVISIFLLLAFLSFTSVPKVTGLNKNAAAKLLKKSSLEAKYTDKYSNRDIGTVVG